MTTQTITPTADAAGTWQLGDRTVNRIGFGAMRLIGSPFATAPGDRDAAVAVLRRAVELGVNHIDTAAFYFTPFQSSNELIATALQPYPDDLVIVTKVGPSRSRAGEFEPYARPDQLRAQVEENLRHLGRDHLDVVNLRWGAGQGTEDGSVAEHVGALAELRDAGLLRHVGVSNVTAAQLAEALTVAPIVCVQNRFGLTERNCDDVLRMCGEHGIAFVPFFAVGAGVEGANPWGPADTTGEDVIAAIAAAHDATPAQVRLAWTLHQGGHVLAIPGTGNPAHLAENVAAGALRLTGDELAALAALVVEEAR
ncbi:aryl-alcohol dehydrogenase-like predicted oxidoreductase [Nocardioides thalensis]|uniref:Aryl-alcohol dehydrogenase-like predicted oxidoreductase n=1 Tax=Nocardioides thalensis TaxID=1914755 RepID=A0A853C407_9ACTN|nr:oxidoreductase [Nocardioides thalensis]NYJ02455.1 aryl-alcohol dehydrogenase-like predicted oxidoreductase [Nocardioides thalensis]